MALFYGERAGGENRRSNVAKARLAHYRALLEEAKKAAKALNAGCLLMSRIPLESAPETVRTYENRLLQIARFIAENPTATIEDFDWSQLTAQHLEELLSALKAEERSKNSAKSVTLIYKRVAKTAFECGAISAEALLAIDKVDRKKVDVRPKLGVISPMVLTRVAEKLLQREDFKARRNGAVFALMVGCGLRRSEVAALNLEDIDGQSRTIFVQGRANGKSRRAVLGVALYPLLERWIEVLQPIAKEKQPLFTRIGKEEGSQEEIIGLHRVTQQTIYNSLMWISETFSAQAPFTPEECRRTYEVLLRKAGFSADVVAAALGTYRAKEARPITEEELRRCADSILTERA